MIASGAGPMHATASSLGIVKWFLGLLVAVWLASVLWISNDIRENRGRIELLRGEISEMRAEIAEMRSEIAEMHSENGQYFARIEALLAERLPPRTDQ